MAAHRKRSFAALSRYPALSAPQAYEEAASYEYYVLAAPSLHETYIDRYTDAAGASGRHDFPFATLGPIQSHILPHFAIFDSGSKIAKLLMVAFADLVRRYELITGNPAEARDAILQILELYDLWTGIEVPTAFKGASGEDLQQTLDAAPSNSGDSKRRAVPPPHGPDSACSVDSDTPFTAAEVAEINGTLAAVAAWRTASSTALSQRHRREKVLSSRQDIGGYAREHAVHGGLASRRAAGGLLPPSFSRGCAREGCERINRRPKL